MFTGGNTEVRPLEPVLVPAHSLILRYNQSTSDLNVPPYAFLPLTSNGEFDLAGAQAAAAGQASKPFQMVSYSILDPYSSLLLPASAPSSSSTPSSSSSAPPTTMTFIPAAATPATSTLAPSAASTSGSNLEIVIAVIVTLTLLATTFGIYLFYKCRKRHFYQPLPPRQDDPVAPILRDADEKYKAKSMEHLPASTKTSVFANSSLLRSLMGSNTARGSPFGKVQLAQKGIENVAPSKQPPQTPTPTPTHMPTLSIPNGSYQPQWNPYKDQLKHGQSEQRPRPTRIDTLPVMQFITRPAPRRSQSSTLPEASTSPRDVVALHPSPESVKNVPRRPGFTIEDTPTTTDGYPRWKRKKPTRRHDFFNPEIGGSVTSFGTYDTGTQRFDGDDSDSVFLISRASDNSDVAPMSAKASSVVSSPMVLLVCLELMSMPLPYSDRSRILPSISRQGQWRGQQCPQCHLLSPREWRGHQCPQCHLLSPREWRGHQCSQCHQLSRRKCTGNKIKPRTVMVLRLVSSFFQRRFERVVIRAFLCGIINVDAS
jgi:hypothetical protein